MTGAHGSAAARRAEVDVDNACFEGILPGRYSLERATREDGSARVFSCRAQKVSADEMLIEGPVCGTVGERIKAWIEHFGFLSGTIAHTGERTLTVRFSLLPKARQKFASKINWVHHHVVENLPDHRCGERRPMPNLKPVIILSSGHVENCFIIDASSSGAAISADIMLRPGTRLALGSIVGTVVREIETGFAMHFDEEQAPETLQEVLGWVPCDQRKEPALTDMI